MNVDDFIKKHNLSERFLKYFDKISFIETGPLCFYICYYHIDENGRVFYWVCYLKGDKDLYKIQFGDVDVGCISNWIIAYHVPYGTVLD